METQIVPFKTIRIDDLEATLRAQLQEVRQVVHAQRKREVDQKTLLFFVIPIGTLAVLAFPSLPLAMVVVSVVSFVFLGNLQNAGHASVRGDDRFKEYVSLLSHLDTWQQWTQFLNRLIAKIECNLIPAGLVQKACEGIEAMRADEQFLLDRIRYAGRLAQEGSLGTVMARQQIGADLVLDLSERVDAMRKRVRELQEIDAQAIAALEVAKLKT
ncbi:hypothetical protein HY733_03335 [Candidatus Uhrbacteria bacterium]|nr:hypothetical protein [Candidatus Uhrbacteria bacterium]